MEPRDSTFCDAPGPGGTGPRNRWLCFFLPLTNCSVEGDYRHEKEGMDFAPTVFLVTASTGVAPIASWRDMMEHFRLNATHERKSDPIVAEFSNVDEALNAIGSMGFKQDDEGKGAFETFGDLTMRTGFLLRNFLFRRNYRFRARVAQEIARHQELEEISEGKTDCIGMHMRRGDKVDDAYWCHLVDPFNPAYGQAPGFNRTFGELTDVAMSLKARLLAATPSRTARVFIATDNQTYVDEQLSHSTGTASLRENVLRLGGQDNLFETKDSRLAQQAVYWASQEIAAMCKGIVINRDSQSSKVMEWMACGRQGHCPVVEDVAQHRPDEEVKAAQLAWERGARPAGYSQRC